jgi:hypothetical protein
MTARLLKAILAEPTCYVRFRPRVIRAGENFVRRSDLYQLAIEEESGEVRNSGCLLHVVGHDDDGVVAFKFVKQVLKPESRCRV